MGSELADSGVVCAPARIRRLMAARGLRAIQPKSYVPKTSNGRADKPSPNPLTGEPPPATPNSAWAGDITFIPTSTGWLYLAVVRELPISLSGSPRNERDLPCTVPPLYVQLRQ